MKTSGNSSATAPPSPDAPPPANAPAHRSFALTGRTVALDPRTHAVRSDIADIRLADRVFAPHYAVPMSRDVVRVAPLRIGKDISSEVVAELAVGETFEILEIAGTTAWGVAVAHGLVGYVEASALDLAAVAA